jgi:hypothetical protein
MHSLQRVLGLLLFAAICLMSGPLGAQAPALGDVAKKEQDRRKALPPAGKVYTNKDLPKPAPRPEGAAEAPAAAAPAGEAAAPPAGDSSPAATQAPPSAKESANTEEAWRKRMEDAREQLRRLELTGDALQTRLNSLHRDFLSRDDPAQKARLGAERKEVQAELARVKQDVERARKQIADLEEEARKAGVPPGWLR